MRRIKAKKKKIEISPSLHTVVPFEENRHSERGHESAENHHDTLIEPNQEDLEGKQGDERDNSNAHKHQTRVEVVPSKSKKETKEEIKQRTKDKQLNSEEKMKEIKVNTTKNRAILISNTPQVFVGV
jgi:hypothetical protein